MPLTLWPRAALAAAATAALVLAACGSPASQMGVAGGSRGDPGSHRAGALRSPPASHEPGSVTPRPPSTSAAPAFLGTIDPVAVADVAATYRPGCPVGPPQLRLLHMSYWGFDGQAHVGTMVVNAAVTGPVLSVFSRLFYERFPIRQMVPEDAYGGSDPASMAADNTSGFNCRFAVAPGPPQWSVHAYGEAIDVDPVENPYLEGGSVQPAAGAAYLDRSIDRPGEAVPGGPLVQAFAAVGWYWGGRWTAAPDYQHFSANGG